MHVCHYRRPARGDWCADWCGRREGHLCVDSAVLVLEAGQVALGPDEDVGVDAGDNVQEGGHGQHHVGEEDYAQGQLQAQVPPVTQRGAAVSADVRGKVPWP